MAIPFCGNKVTQNGRAEGYTLIELVIVMVIIGIMATQVVFVFLDPTGRVKSAAFSLRSDFNLARFEAVNRNQDVLIDFAFNVKPDCVAGGKYLSSSADFTANCLDGTGDRDGYFLCVDANASNTCDFGETFIKAPVIFRQEIQYYDPAAIITDGPENTPGGASLIGKDGVLIGGVGTNWIKMEPDGTSSNNGTVVVFFPEKNSNHQIIQGQPFALVISSATTGRVRLNRWRPGSGWSKK